MSQVVDDIFMASNMPWIKYVKRQHIDSVLGGTFRIGTLHEYRNQELYGDELGDGGEGTRLIQLDNVLMTDEDLGRSTAKAEFMRSIIGVEGNAKITIEGGTFIQHEQAPDCYLYCISRTYNPTIMKALGYDAAIRINDKLKFGRLLMTSAAKQLGIRLKCHGYPCEYVGRHEFFNNPSGFPVERLKEKRHFYQQEDRLVMKPNPSTKAKLTWFLLQCTEAGKLCSIVDDSNLG